MRLLGMLVLSRAVVLLLLPLIDATSVTLSQFQQISGFSKACALAYNTPLTKCTELDFASGRACSIQCVEQLEHISVVINSQCKGTKAYPDTLIGMFFTQAGVSTLCPNVLSSGEGSGGSIAQTSTVISAKTPLISVVHSTRKASQTPSATQQTTLQSLASSAATSTTRSSDEAASSLPTNTQSPTAQATINSAATLTQSSILSFGSSTVQAVSSATTSSAKASASSQQDQAGNRSNDGSNGGGTPFDITSNSNRIAAGLSWILSTLSCLLAIMWFI